MIFWLHEKPQPHANGLRFLAASGIDEGHRGHAQVGRTPRCALPKEGQQPPLPREWDVAQSALRYVGWLKDPQSWGVLEKGLTVASDKKIDVTMESLMGGGLAHLGMTLRAIGVGASRRLRAVGRSQGLPAPDRSTSRTSKRTSRSRIEACFALAWVGDRRQHVRDRQEDRRSTRARSRRSSSSAAATSKLSLHRPVPGTAAGLVEMIDKDTDIEVRHQIARAIGFGGFDDKVQAALFKKMEDVDMRNDAALALILGGSIDTATKAVAMYADYPKEGLDELKDIYYRSFGYWSDDDLVKGRLYKWVDTAEAIARISVKDTLQDWTRLRLQAQFENLDFDNGPHSMTRVVLRYRVMEDARKGDSAKKKGRHPDAQVHEGARLADGAARRAGRNRAARGQGVLRVHEPQDRRRREHPRRQRALRRQRHPRKEVNVARLALATVVLSLSCRKPLPPKPAAIPAAGKDDFEIGAIDTGGIPLPATCTPSGPEICFDAIDNNCNGVIDEGCGVGTGPLQFEIAWPDGPDVDLKVTYRKKGDTADRPLAELTKDKECGRPQNNCHGQNIENVYFAGDRAATRLLRGGDQARQRGGARLCAGAFRCSPGIANNRISQCRAFVVEASSGADGPGDRSDQEIHVRDQVAATPWQGYKRRAMNRGKSRRGGQHGSC